MSNQFDAVVLKRFVGEIERHHQTIASYKGEHAQRVKTILEQITDCFDRAKAAGIPKKELKAVIRERKLLEQIEALREEMEPEQQETLDQIKHALGMLSDLPLGEAAQKRSAAVNSLTDDDDDEEDADEVAGRANAEALSAGIQPKH